MLQYNFKIITKDGERFEITSAVIPTKEDAITHIQTAMERGRLPLSTAACFSDLVSKAPNWPTRVLPIKPYVIKIMEGRIILGKIIFTALVESTK